MALVQHQRAQKHLFHSGDRCARRRAQQSAPNEVTLRTPGIAMADAAAEKRAANKFSRQNAALGAETTKFLREAKVLIVGLRGAGIERRTNQI